jgi:hypothetical protein
VTASFGVQTDVFVFLLGFIQSELREQHLTPLRRWYLQLKLLQHGNTIDEKELQETDEEETFELKSLKRDNLCFDLKYVSREVAEIDESTHEEALSHFSDPTEEVLSFASRKNSLVQRVLCGRKLDEYSLVSDRLVPNLTGRLADLLEKNSTAETLLELIWAAASTAPI